MERLGKLFLLVDALLMTFIFAPLVVFYWRGTWQLMDIYLAPEHLGLSALSSSIIGFAGTLIIHLFQQPLHEFLQERSSITYLFLTRLYTYVYSFINVNQWRGVWVGLDHITGVNLFSSGGSALIGFVGLCLLRTSRCAIAPPIILGHDINAEYVLIPTRFGVKKSHVYDFFLDCFLTVIVIQALIVFIWRGTWELMDLYLAPDSDLVTSWVSWGMGTGLVLLCCALQPLAAAFSRYLEDHPVAKTIFEDAFFAVANFATINLWRGVWYLCNFYILPEEDMYAVSNGLTHAVGAGLLILFVNQNSILVRGIVLDGGLPDGSGCWFQTQFLQVVIDAMPCTGESRPKISSDGKEVKTYRTEKKANNATIDADLAITGTTAVDVNSTNF